MEQGLLDKTGKTLDEWIKIVKAKNFVKHGEYLAYLKEEHGMSHGFANFVAHKARQSDAASFEDEDLVALQYSKGKEHLKPIHDRLIELVSSFGDDVEIVPKKSSVSVRRKKQFALIQPSTKTRIDLGIKLRNTPVGERLEGSGPFGTMCTHRVRLEDVRQVDDELEGWLRGAYEEAG
jgi:hypothetical protein